jgi:hypothetical protein
MSGEGGIEMIGHKAIRLVTVLSMLLVTFAPAVSAQTPEVDPKMQPYVDALAYWFQSMGYEDWQARVDQALVAAPDQPRNPDADRDEDEDEDDDKDPEAFIPQFPSAERVYLAGVPGSAWWIDVWGLDLDATWVKVPAFHPAGQVPGVVSGDLVTQGKLPGVYVIRVCDKSGAVLLDAPRLIVVSWTGGSGGTWQQLFDVPNLPKATADMLGGITM